MIERICSDMDSSKNNLLKIRRIITFYTGIDGHRSSLDINSQIQLHFTFQKLYEEIKSFVKFCLHA